MKAKHCLIFINPFFIHERIVILILRKIDIQHAHLIIDNKLNWDCNEGRAWLFTCQSVSSLLLAALCDCMTAPVGVRMICGLISVYHFCLVCSRLPLSLWRVSGTACLGSAWRRCLEGWSLCSSDLKGASVVVGDCYGLLIPDNVDVGIERTLPVSKNGIMDSIEIELDVTYTYIIDDLLVALIYSRWTCVFLHS